MSNPTTENVDVRFFAQLHNKDFSFYGLITMTDHAMSLANQLHAHQEELKNVKSMDTYWRNENKRLFEEVNGLKAELEAARTAIADLKDREETNLLMLKKAKEAAKK